MHELLLRAFFGLASLVVIYLWYYHRRSRKTRRQNHRQRWLDLTSSIPSDDAKKEEEGDATTYQ